jgi:hypothetical protein
MDLQGQHSMAWSSKFRTKCASFLFSFVLWFCSLL